MCLPFFGIAQDYQLDFNSATLDYVEMPNASSFIANKTEFTISGWVNPQLDGSHSGLIGFRNDVDADFFLLQLQNSTNVEARFRNSSGVKFDIVASNLLDIGQWQHLAFTYDGVNIKLYKNGIFINSTAANGTISNISQSFRIGSLAWQTTSFPMQGSVDEVRLWGAALDSSTISSWMCTAIDLTHPNYTNLLGYWRLNDGTGTLVTDNSPSSLNGTLYNATWNLTTTCFATAISGCTDSLACNYNPNASIDDGSCYFISAQINQMGLDLELTVNGGISPLSFVWNTGETTMTITPLQNGQFWALVTDANSCVTDTVYFTVNNIPASINDINSESRIVKIVDIFGKKVSNSSNTILFYIHENGIVEKRITLE